MASIFERDLRKAKAEEVKAGSDESFGEERDFFSAEGFSLGLGEPGVGRGRPSRR